MALSVTPGEAITDDPALAELLALWSRLPDEMRQSLLRIARARAACSASSDRTGND